MADTTQTTAGSPFGDTSVPVPSEQRQAGQAAGRAISDVQEMGTELVTAVRDSATALFEEQRNRAADEIAALGEALRRSAQSLDQSGGTVARYADDAARQIGDFAATLRQRSWNEMAGDVEDFARRWPAVFMCAAVGIGFVAGRFLMSSSAGPNAGAAASPTTAIQPRPAMARDAGSVSGAVSGTGYSGYGATTPRETG